MTLSQRMAGVGDGSGDLTVLWASGNALMLPDKDLQLASCLRPLDREYLGNMVTVNR